MTHRAVASVLFFVSLSAAAGDRGALGLPELPIPANNPQSAEKIALGKKLFSDRFLSTDGTVSCSSCHLPEKAFSDGRVVAEGIRKQKGTRNSPTLLNVAFNTSQFWDGRRATLEEQAKDPFVNAAEHGFASHAELLQVVRGDVEYARSFQRAYGVGPDEVTIDHISQAIAAFERTLLAGDSPFDRFLYGNDRNAISPAAQRGLDLFRGRAGCAECHVIEKNFALFTDNKFHSAGVGFNRIQPRLADITTRYMKLKGETVSAIPGSKIIDETVMSDADISELGHFVVTADPADIGKFKTPTLRNVALTAPYMHDGSIATVLDVIEIELYVRSTEANRPVVLTPDEKNDLVEFLKSLTSPNLEAVSR